MAASAFESDLDLAFRLQLEEAMAASLAFQSSSSNSPPVNDNINLIDLQTLEFKTKKLKLDRDHENEILHMPRDNSDKSYGESSSSSSKGESSSEVFRVYFKGMIEEDRVGGCGSKRKRKAVAVAGIGIAICDSRDELIYEMKKPLDMVKDGLVSKMCVEEKALIEALNASAALNLKRIVFYCDYHTLYQYVSGRWRPKQERIKRFVDQVNLIRKKFSHCEPAYVAQKDVKFAIELARGVIKSLKEKAVELSHEIEKCVICLEDKIKDNFIQVDGCNHRYCDSCMKKHAEIRLLQGMVPKCPHEDCDSDLGIETCEMFLTPKRIEMMRKHLKEASIPVAEKVYCPYPKCSTLMSKTELQRFPRYVNEGGARTCNKCHGNFCINCRVPWHIDMTCVEYKRKNPMPPVEESKLKTLAAENLWRQCIKCQHIIELTTGCYHMTCRCGYEFCYTCGAEWKNKKATCSCILWDEENIMDVEESDDEDDWM
ncbi:E3 ubiquitin-protein ligase RSL1-like [Rutidosis leptorrhynchoides]|uniref:E3 ubiquitin-protein ligase RSL1-like n=1 Tax=Rutidosis leptorrhynchoides TaxID=125765 RepID=UPI003A9944DA